MCALWHKVEHLEAKPNMSYNTVNPLHLLTMPSSTVVSQAVDRTAAEQAKFVDLPRQAVVDKAWIED
jgi:hypothetical protein